MKEQPKFDINSAVVRQLGKELVSDEVTALIELVKNAYDADANYANIIVTTDHIESDDIDSKEFRGMISIEDDGNGMNEDEIRRGWLTISLSAKRDMKRLGVTTKKGRTPLGDKGLGRLSTQRLGRKLDLITRKDGEEDTHHLSFDWDDFTENIALSDVPVSFKQGMNRKKGTKLIISGLINPDIWLGSTQLELMKKLSQLISPFTKIRPFQVFMSINGRNIELDNIAESIRDAAIARFKIDYQSGILSISGKIRISRMRANNDDSIESYNRLLSQDNGREFFSYLTSSKNKTRISNIEYIGDEGWFIAFADKRVLSNLGGVSTANSGQNLLDLDFLSSDQGMGSVVADPGDFTSEIDEFVLKGGDLQENNSVFDNKSEFTDLIKSQSGIRIFRDGFGIRPYGLQGNDWLNLGGGQTSGRSYYGLRPQNVIGYVALSEAKNAVLREKTDREGFLDSPYSQNFFLLMGEAIKIINVTYNNLRRSYNEYRKDDSSEHIGGIDTKKSLSVMHETAVSAEKIQRRTRNLDERIINIEENIKSVTNKVDSSPIFASPEENALAPLLKEVSSTLSDARSLTNELQSLLPHAIRLGKIADYFEPKIIQLETQLEEFSELAGLGLTAEALSHEIHNVADRLSAQTKVIIDVIKKRVLEKHEIITYTEYINSAVSSLRKQINHLTPSLKYVRERKDILSIHSFFMEIKYFYETRLASSEIKLLLKEPFNDFYVKINKGRLTQIIDNIILNSEYWLKHGIELKKVSDPTIIISWRKPYVMIEDNGLGVDPSIERSIFQPFTTTKPKNQGRGLGLFIVQQLLDSMGGTITLLPDRNSYDRRYIFEIDMTGVLYEQ